MLVFCSLLHVHDDHSSTALRTSLPCGALLKYRNLQRSYLCSFVFTTACPRPMSIASAAVGSGEGSSAGRAPGRQAEAGAPLGLNPGRRVSVRVHDAGSGWPARLVGLTSRIKPPLSGLRYRREPRTHSPLYERPYCLLTAHTTVAAAATHSTAQHLLDSARDTEPLLLLATLDKRRSAVWP